MTAFHVYASNFDLHPKRGDAFGHLSRLLQGLERLNFRLRVDDPSVNQGQMISDFDDELEKWLLAHGATSFNLQLPPDIPQEPRFRLHL